MLQVRESMTIAEHKLEKVDASPNESKLTSDNRRQDTTNANEDFIIVS